MKTFFNEIIDLFTKKEKFKEEPNIQFENIEMSEYLKLEVISEFIKNNKKPQPF
jgi:hypothetical protein